jgi:DNA-binding PadR family transcriptional regulator
VFDSNTSSRAGRLTGKGRRALEVARRLWVRAQDILRELGTKAWASAQRRLAHLLRVAVKKRRFPPVPAAGEPS